MGVLGKAQREDATSLSPMWKLDCFCLYSREGQCARAKVEGHGQDIGHEMSYNRIIL